MHEWNAATWVFFGSAIVFGWFIVPWIGARWPSTKKRMDGLTLVLCLLLLLHWIWEALQ